ncbi:hypothetical protein GFS24_09345 [Chitinophaga sp. SYP-B3965]|uniref:hypothetical protein n=1 Tax=Chitinophaga sp. SYP-B3965 TaxID=2663120 RepID=UPI0012997B29|nr:hypothetical protein [Chitinophaga sp. SYP-B3965]MRG45320.1 hypothetical protein [Chitinophaga sp. SYP-B3965]
MKHYFFLLLPIVLLSSCYSTNITGYWRSDAQPAKTGKTILVLGLMPDTVMRERMEEHVAGDLQRLGYHAIRSLGNIDAMQFTKTEDKDALQQFREKGIDGVLTIVLLNKTTEGFLMPGSLYHLLTDYYNTMYFGLYAPDFYQEGIKYAWETSFYDVASGSRLYAVQTTTFHPLSIEKLSHEYGRVVVKCMVKHKVLKRHF